MIEPVGHYFIVALPRSRTAWLANLLTWGPSFCFHEGLIGCRNMAELRAKLSLPRTPLAGNADTGSMMAVDKLVEAFPDARYVLLCRNPDGFVEQAARMGADREHALSMLDTFAHACDVLHGRALVVRSADLDRRETVEAIWNHVGIAEPFPAMRYEQLRDTKVEAILSRVRERAEQHADELMELIGG